MRDRILPFAVALTTVVVALVGLPPQLRADDSLKDEIEGRFEAVRSQSEARKRIDKQVEAVVEQMPFYKRPFARGELQDATKPCDKVVFKFDEGNISITCGNRKPAVSNPDGTPTEWLNGEGESHTLTQTVKSDRVVQTFKNDQGSRTNVYRLKDEETLVLEATLDSSQMPEPLTFTRTFERAEQ